MDIFDFLLGVYREGGTSFRPGQEGFKPFLLLLKGSVPTFLQPHPFPLKQ